MPSFVPGTMGDSWASIGATLLGPRCCANSCDATALRGSDIECLRPASVGEAVALARCAMGHVGRRGTPAGSVSGRAFLVERWPIGFRVRFLCCRGVLECPDQACATTCGVTVKGPLPLAISVGAAHDDEDERRSCGIGSRHPSRG